MKKTEVTREDRRNFFLPDFQSKENTKFEESFFKGVRQEDFVNAHKEDLENLKEIDGYFEELLDAFEPERHPRQALEAIAAAKMDSILRIARRFHPFSDYGKEYLSEYIKCRKAFENKAGLYTTNIVKSNSSVFASVLSVDLRECVDVGKYYAIGALRSDMYDTFGAGALVYYYDTDPVSGDRIIRIKWLYVDEDFRERKVATSLLAEIANIAVKKNINTICAEYPVDDFVDIFGDMFTDWHFGFAGGISPEFVCALKDAAVNQDLDGYLDKAVSLSEEDNPSEVIRRFFKKTGYTGYLSGKLPEGYFDPELSFYTGNAGNCDGLLLAHILPSGKISVEYAGCCEGKEEDIETLVGAMAANALSTYDRSTEICMEVEDLDDGEMLDEMFPKQKGNMIIGAVLDSPGEDGNATREIVEGYLV